MASQPEKEEEKPLKQEEEMEQCSAEFANSCNYESSEASKKKKEARDDAFLEQQLQSELDGLALEEDPGTLLSPSTPSSSSFASPRKGKPLLKDIIKSIHGFVEKQDTTEFARLMEGILQSSGYKTGHMLLTRCFRKKSVPATQFLFTVVWKEKICASLATMILQIVPASTVEECRDFILNLVRKDLLGVLAPHDFSQTAPDQEVEQSETPPKRCSLEPPLLFRIVKMLKLSTDHLEEAHIMSYIHRILFGEPERGVPADAYLHLLVAPQSPRSPYAPPTHVHEDNIHTKMLKINPKAISVVIRLVSYFKLPKFHHHFLLRHLVELEHWSLAIEYVADLDKSHQLSLLQMCIAKSQLRIANQIISKFSLQSDTPEIDIECKEYTIRRMVEKGLVESAGAKAAGNKDLEIFFIETLIEFDEVTLALQYREKFGLNDQITISEEQIKTALAHMSESVLMFPWDLSVIVMVDTEALLEDALAKILNQPTDDPERPPVAGLDSEWRPYVKGSSSSGEARVSILQIATREHVFIVDLISLPADTLELFLSKLFRSSVIKIGFAFDSDVHMLKNTFPESTALASLDNFVELKDAADLIYSDWGCSLSQLCHRVLGKSLSKVDRLSDWELRPLSSRQLVYAALDSLCLVWLLDALQTEYNVSHIGRSIIWECTTVTPLRKKPHKKKPTSKTSHEGFPDLEASLLEEADSDGGENEETPSSEVVDIDYLRFQPENTDPTCPLTSKSVLAYLKAFDLDTSMLGPKQSEEIAGSSATSSALINECKCLAFIADQTPIMVVSRREMRVPPKVIADILKLRRRAVRLATPLECIEIFGYVPGSMPPFAHRTRCRTFVDSMLLKQPAITLGGGQLDIRLKIDPALLVKNTRAELLTFTVENQIVQIPDPSKLTFMMDSMLGRLVKWLRCIGVDASYNPKLGRDEMIELAKKEGRILITTDKSIPMRKYAGPCFLVTQSEMTVQFTEVSCHFGLTLDHAHFMSRCTRCNILGFRSLTKEQVRGRVPDRIIDRIPEFWDCTGCGKVVWKGSQFRRAQKMFEEIYGHALEQELHEADEEDLLKDDLEEDDDDFLPSNNTNVGVSQTSVDVLGGTQLLPEYDNDDSDIIFKE